MQKVIPLKRSKIDYSRKHDLTDEEIRESATFRSSTDPEVEDIKATFLQMCQILLEIIEDQEIVLGTSPNKSHIAAGQIIELEQLKNKAA